MKLIFQPDAIQELLHLDPGMVDVLIVEFTKQAEEHIALIRECDDLATLERLAHTVKSSSGALGFEQLAALCLSIEMAAREKRKLPDQTAELERLSKSALDEIKAYMQSRA